jgi:hypothetical protein
MTMGRLRLPVLVAVACAACGRDLVTPGDAVANRDAKSTTSVDARDPLPSGDAGSVACGAQAPSNLDAGACLRIYYATIAELVLWVEDSSVAGGSARVRLGEGDEVRAGAHTYGYSGNSLITSGSRVELHIDVDGVVNAMGFVLQGCAPKTGNRAWDFPAAFTRRPCLACSPTSSGRHYSVVESGAEGGVVYTFTADEPARSCGAGVDLLSFTTLPG